MRRPGKKIHPYIYTHISAISDAGIPMDEWVEADSLLPVNFEYSVVRYNTKTGDFQFTESYDWDTADEPIVGDQITIKANGDITERVHNPDNPQIYHHKWMFVNDSYEGFDVAESMERSEEWEALGVDKRRIGYKRYWEGQVLPLLEE